jgi:hypothetical protein
MIDEKKSYGYQEVIGERFYIEKNGGDQRWNKDV